MHIVLATWYVKYGERDKAVSALKKLAKSVEASEEGTLAYMVHTGGSGSTPPVSSDTIVFIEIYKDEAAFLAHIQGKAFTSFLKQNGDLFVQSPGGDGAYFQATNLDRIAGFFKPEAIA